jgi:hypothetical protein
MGDSSRPTRFAAMINGFSDRPDDRSDPYDGAPVDCGRCAQRRANAGPDPAHGQGRPVRAGRKLLAIFAVAASAMSCSSRDHVEDDYVTDVRYSDIATAQPSGGCAKRLAVGHVPGQLTKVWVLQCRWTTRPEVKPTLTLTASAQETNRWM